MLLCCRIRDAKWLPVSNLAARILKSICDCGNQAACNQLSDDIGWPCESQKHRSDRSVIDRQIGWQPAARRTDSEISVRQR
jgi:hypothetical protein